MSPAELELHLAFGNLPKVTPQSFEYRIYYNELGEITSCSMQKHEDGPHIVVSKDEYDSYFKYKVVNGKLKLIEHDARFSVQLNKASTGIKVVHGHAGLIIETNEEWPHVEHYEYRNSRHCRS